MTLMLRSRFEQDFPLSRMRGNMDAEGFIISNPEIDNRK
jgi:hypothetical protein